MVVYHSLLDNSAISVRINGTDQVHILMHGWSHFESQTISFLLNTHS